MSKKHQNVCRVLNYFEHFLVFVSVVSAYISACVFVSLVGVSSCIASSAAEMENSAITEGMKKYKSIMKKESKKHEFNTVKVLNFKALSDSYINHGRLVSVNIKTLETCYDSCKTSTPNQNPTIRRTK